MGEIANLIIEGDVCQYCMCELGIGPGYPRSCRSCAVPPRTTSVQPMTTCPHCKKSVKLVGLQQHIKAKHP